jgi:hypothetical protein
MRPANRTRTAWCPLGSAGPVRQMDGSGVCLLGRHVMDAIPRRCPLYASLISLGEMRQGDRIAHPRSPPPEHVIKIQMNASVRRRIAGALPRRRSVPSAIGPFDFKFINLLAV